MLKQLNDAVAALSPLLKGDACPRIGLILGSGLGVFADKLSLSRSIPYSEIPGFPQSTVEGHAGRLVYGHVDDIAVIALQGRFSSSETGRSSKSGKPLNYN